MIMVYYKYSKYTSTSSSSSYFVRMVKYMLSTWLRNVRNMLYEFKPVVEKGQAIVYFLIVSTSKVFLQSK